MQTVVRMGMDSQTHADPLKQWGVWEWIVRYMLIDSHGGENGNG